MGVALIQFFKTKHGNICTVIQDEKEDSVVSIYYIDIVSIYPCDTNVFDFCQHLVHKMHIGVCISIIPLEFHSTSHSHPRIEGLHHGSFQDLHPKI